MREWLRSFGPGSLTDLTWWLGDTQAHVRAALATVGAVEVAVEGTSARGLRPRPTTSSPSSRSRRGRHCCPRSTRRRWGGRSGGGTSATTRGELFDRAGNGGTTAWWDGRIVGAWHQLDGPDVRIHLLEDIGTEGAGALEQEAARLTAWLDGRAPRRPLAVAGAHAAAGALSGQSSSGRGVNSADAGEAPAIASAARTTAAAV